MFRNCVLIQRFLVRGQEKLWDAMSSSASGMEVSLCFAYRA